MGQLRFRVHDRNRIAPGGLQRIYVAGIEEVPWSTRAYWDGDLLVVERFNNESGSVYVPWQVEGQGTRLLNTATLMERERPYLLEVELARGLLHRVRNRLFLWEWLGLVADPPLREKLHDATREFALAATSQDEHAEAAVAANRSLTHTLATAEALVEAYSQQAIAARKRSSPLTTLMGVSLGPETPSVEVRRQLVDACNIVQLPISWKAVEQREGRRDWKATDEQLTWAQKAGMKIAAGPLLRLDDWGLPDWMVLWEGDFENLAGLMLDHVKAVVSRYMGRVHLWHVSSRVNTSKAMGLEEEQRLHLVAQALDVVRQIDPRTPVVVSFDQPWAEYLSQQDEDLAPLHYADALVRADLGVSGFGLEINTGYHPGGCSQRATFELGRLLDQWSIWGLPLMVTLTTPSSAEPDPLAKRKAEVELLGQNLASPQHDWAASVLPLLLARNTVQVVFWNQLSDAQPHEFPHGGLFDSEGKAKSTLSLMRDLRGSLL